MLSLREAQGRLREAIVIGNAGGAADLLVGGSDPARRLAIHQRHYAASLVAALLTKFPATAWLVGEPFLRTAATDFVRTNPPQAPCIAEYGETFPAFVSSHGGASRLLPCLQPFAELEWLIGKVAIAVPHPAADAERLSQLAGDVIVESNVTLQPGLHYLAADWPIDELMTFYLADNAPDQYRLVPREVWLEIRGAHGSFEINRLDAAEFLFRKIMQEGRSIGDAVEHAISMDTSFDPGRALVQLVRAGLVTSIVTTHPKGR